MGGGQREGTKTKEFGELGKGQKGDPGSALESEIQTAAGSENA